MTFAIEIDRAHRIECETLEELIIAARALYDIQQEHHVILASQLEAVREENTRLRSNLVGAVDVGQLKAERDAAYEARSSAINERDQARRLLEAAEAKLARRKTR